MQCFWNHECKYLSVKEQIHCLMTMIPTDLDEALHQFIWQMLFAMRQKWWVQIYGVFVSMPNFTLQKRELSWFSCWKSHHENAEQNWTAFQRLSRAVYRFLHALKYQHINQTLSWYLLRCFYHRIGNFRKKVENAVRDYFKNVCPDKKAAYYFSKTRQKIILQIVLANAKCFQ